MHIKRINAWTPSQTKLFARIDRITLNAEKSVRPKCVVLCIVSVSRWLKLLVEKDIKATLHALKTTLIPCSAPANMSLSKSTK